MRMAQRAPKAAILWAPTERQLRGNPLTVVANRRCGIVGLAETTLLQRHSHWIRRGTPLKG